MIEIWERGNTFPQQMLADFKQRLGARKTLSGLQPPARVAEQGSDVFVSAAAPPAIGTPTGATSDLTAQPQTAPRERLLCPVSCGVPWFMQRALLLNVPLLPSHSLDLTSASFDIHFPDQQKCPTTKICTAVESVTRVSWRACQVMAPTPKVKT